VTAQLDDVVSAQPSTPTPTAQYARWFPAHVTLPNGQARHSVRVHATDTGLYVFATRPPADDDLSGALFWSPIDWPATLELTPALPTPRLGFQIVTDAGTVAVGQMVGCGCHLRDLKSWVPSWTSRTLPWGEASA
jgi:hypothetical protein